jgi:hypothetical protein
VIRRGRKEKDPLAKLAITPTSGWKNHQKAYTYLMMIIIII